MTSFFSYMRGNVLVLTVTRALLFFSTNLFNPYFSLYLLALGGTSAQLGFVFALNFIATLVVYPIAGYIADSRGRVKLIWAAFYLRSTEFILYAAAQNWNIMAVGQFTDGLTDFQAPAMGAIMADSLPPKRRGIGFASMNTLPTAFSIVAPFIGGYVITVFGLDPGVRYLAICGAIGCIACATLRLKYLKETLSDTREMSMKNIPLLLKNSYKSMWEAIKQTPNNLRHLVFVMALIQCVCAVAAPFWIVYGTTVIKLTALEWGSMLLLVGISSVVFALPAGTIIDRFGKKKIFIAALALLISPVFLFTYCKTFMQTLVVHLLIAVATSLLTPLCQTLVADNIPRKNRGRFDAAFGRGGINITTLGDTTGFVPSTVSTLGSLAGGFIYGFNSTYPWFILSAGLILSLFIYIIFTKEPEKAEL